LATARGAIPVRGLVISVKPRHDLRVAEVIWALAEPAAPEGEAAGAPRPSARSA
jgi:hypothetical protein